MKDYKSTSRERKTVHDGTFWPFADPEVKRAQRLVKCQETKRPIHPGTMAVHYRGYWYCLDSVKGQELAADADDAPLTYF